ncbi:MAG: TonB-dependent receptor [Bacteriovoracaceae bacterium]|nr:TonB-dependent receptor [Bacteriovoracaceae bacterium]
MWIFILLQSLCLAQTYQLNQIDVHDTPSSLYQFIPSSSVLKGDELQRKRETSLGDTLQKEAGVSSSSFGPGAARPVLRGLDGDRIRVLQNGLGSMDASAQSVDHGVPVDMLNTDQIDIVRGPMSLLYGASAVGGIVNITNQRIHSSFEEGALSQIDLRHESAYGGGASAARLDWGKNNWMTHFDGSFRDMGDQRISGGDRLKNTQVQQETVSGGFSKILKRGYVGLSLNHFGSQYGSVAEESVRIHLRQNRYELAGEYKFDEMFFDKIRFRSAQAMYRHDEFEGKTVGTVFKNEGNESRLEVIRSRGDWNHVMGVHSQLFSFSAQGDEAYLPTTFNEHFSLFTYHQKKLDTSTFDFGGRVENSLVDKKSSQGFGEKTDRGFTGLSASAGYKKNWNENSVALTGSYTERAPTFQELFSNGGHVATGTFERGDKNLKKEKSRSVELTFARKTSDWDGRLSSYIQDFENYIALAPTGSVDSGTGFDIYDYESDAARIYGMETENTFKLNPNWNLVAKGDWVRGKNLKTGKNLPRLSPARVSMGLEWSRENWTLDTELQHAFEQQHINPNESRTAQYDLLSLGAQRVFVLAQMSVTGFLRLKNIFDDRARNHVSTVKNIAPMAGRNIVLGMNAAW